MPVTDVRAAGAFAAPATRRSGGRCEDQVGVRRGGHVACGALPLAGLAGADTRAKTTVTIDVQGTEYHGTVSSPKPKKCAKDRKIVLYKQKGKVQDRSVDEKVGMDTASLSGGVYVWNTGNTGLYGKFYAWAGRTEYCKAAASPTIKNPKP